MLDQQFFGDEKNHPYLNEKFVVFKANWETPEHRPVFEKFNTGYEIVVYVMPDGTEFDRVAVPYPPEAFRELTEKTLRDPDTLPNLLKSYEKNSANLEVNVKLVKKYTSIYNRGEAAKYAAEILKDPSNAKNYRVSIELNPENTVEANAYEYGLATVSYAKPEKALDFFKEFPNSKIQDVAITFLSRSLRNDKTRSSAGQAFRTLAEKYPDNQNIVLNFVGVLANSGKELDLALKLSDKLYSKDPSKLNGNFYTTYATLLISTKNENKAYKIVDGYLKVNPTSDGFRQDIQSVYVDNKLYDKAIQIFEDGIKINPDNVYFYYGIGRVSAISGENLEKGIKYLEMFMEKAPDLDPSFAVASWQSAPLWRMGIIYEHMRKPDKAMAMYEKAIKIDPNRVEAKEALEKLKKK